MTSVKYTCPYQDKSPRLSKYSSMNSPKYKTNHIHTFPQTMEKKVQFAIEIEKSPLVSKEDNKFIMQVTVNFLFRAIAVDSKMLPTLSALASEQSSPTEAKMKRCKQFLDYAASQEESVLTYRASNMILAIHSDASYLS